MRCSYSVVIDLWKYCAMLQVILTPTCRVSGYPRQVIKVDTLLRQLRFIWTALPTVITLNNYTTRHLQHFELVYLPSRQCDPTSPPLFSDDCCPLESSFYWPFLLAPLLAATFTDRSFYWMSLLPSLSLISCLVLLHTEHHFQFFRCWFNGLIVPLPRAGLLFVERFPRQRYVISVA
jgi:hypothetical protein